MIKEQEPNKMIEGILFEFFAVYSIEFKKNNQIIPSFISFVTEEFQNYDDNNYYDDIRISQIYFYDKEENVINLDFEVEDEYAYMVNITQALIEELYYVELENYSENTKKFKTGF